MYTEPTIKTYTPTTELEKLQAQHLSYIFKEAVKYKAALFEIIDGLRLVDQYNLGVRGILEKHGIEIPEGKEVW